MKQFGYIVIITLFLFAIVFAFNLPRHDKAENGAEAAASDTEESGSQTSVTTAVTAASEPVREIDNEWALILVNNSNPLPDDYTVDTAVVYSSYELEARCAEYAKRMLADAAAAGCGIKVISGYRSIDYQKMLFSNDMKRYTDQGKTEAEAYEITAKNIAIPGKSEHNLGLAMDVANIDWQGEITEEFENTPEFEWLRENCWKYGFIMRYPKDKVAITEFVYEPWHYRFVGVYHAERIMKSGVSLEEYMAALPEGGTTASADVTSVTTAPTETSYSQKVSITA